MNNHYEENILRIEKFDTDKVWTAVLFDADNQGYPYMKRFQMEAVKRKQNFLGENVASKLVLLTDVVYPLVKVTYGGADEFRGSENIDAEQFIGVKGFKAKGKRLSTWQVETIEELEPVRFPKENEDEENDGSAIDGVDDVENLDPDSGKSEQQVIDEMTGQLRLFPDEE